MPVSALTRATSNAFAAADSFTRAADSFSARAAESLFSRAAGPVSRAAGTVSRAADAVSRAAGTATRNRQRVPVLAASAATAGLLGASGFALGAAPWAQALTGAQAGGKVATGHPGAFAFAPLTSGSSGGSELEALQSAAASAHVTAVGFAQHAATAAKPAAATPILADAAAAKAAAAKATAAKQAAAKAAAAKAAAKAAAAKAAAAAAKPYFMYDSVEPGALPAGQAAAVYATGPYAAQSSQVAGHNSLLWIDTMGSDPAANVLDVEPGDATPSGATQWVKARLTANHNAVAIVYTMRNDWQEVKDGVATLPSWMQSKVRYWIADPTGVSHIVPGASATQWYWGGQYDISTASPDFNR